MISEKKHQKKDRNCDSKKGTEHVDRQKEYMD